MKKTSKKDPRQTLANWLVPFAIILLFLALRVPALGRFATTDEALWLRRSANFYFAISNGEWADTFQSEHPGLVTQWAGAAGFWLRFPDYAQVGSPGIHDDELVDRMENRGVSPMQVLAAGRFTLVLVHAVAFAGMWPFASRLLGLRAAAMGMALLALDPFTIAHQRLLHLDGLLASFMLLAILAFIDFQNTRRISALVVSGIAAGLAMLTKTPALILAPVLLTLTFWKTWQEREDWKFWLGHFLVLGLIGTLAVFVFFPALWAQPVDIILQMLSYALGSAQGEYSGPLFFNGQVYADGDFGAVGWIFYPVSYFFRNTPLTLLGLAAATWVFAKNRSTKSKDPTIDLQAIAQLTLFAILIAFFMTVADKKFDRYLLPAHMPLLLVAGWGWAKLRAATAWLRKSTARSVALLTTVGALQLASALPTSPYYLSYYNPLLAARTQDVMQIGWGEGLDQAANYLSAQPAIETMQVASWYSTSFNLMFPDKANDIPILIELSNLDVLRLLSNDYLVIYIHQWQRGTPQNLLDTLQETEPEYLVWINGLEYVRIYHQDPLIKPHADGVYQVGVQIAPGTWRSVGGSGDSCYWVRRKYDGIVLEDYLGLPGAEIQILEGDFEVEFDGCGLWEYMNGS